MARFNTAAKLTHTWYGASKPPASFNRRQNTIIVARIAAHSTTISTKAPIRGVTDVVNLLKVNPPPKYTDEALEARIYDRLRQTTDSRWMTHLIDVEVKDGRATLYGSVDFWSQWHEAQNVASTTDGVWSVDNRLKVLTG